MIVSYDGDIFHTVILTSYTALNPLMRPKCSTCYYPKQIHSSHHLINCLGPLIRCTLRFVQNIVDKLCTIALLSVIIYLLIYD